VFDHVLVAVSDLAASTRFYRTVLGIEPPHADDEIVEWGDWDTLLTNSTHPVTRGLHVAFRVDRASAALIDPDGTRVETVPADGERAGRIDHLSLRVRDPQASKRFYATIAPYAGLRLEHDEEDAVRFTGLSLIRDERPPTEHVHIAFRAHEDATVRAFHAAALAAGYTDHGAPGKRPHYHAGYYGAFVLDPDGHNIEVVNHNLG
jgi:catechol 2,3-dioxygenase-like lactoylglutathione lyase family enzyme